MASWSEQWGHHGSPDTGHFCDFWQVINFLYSTCNLAPHTTHLHGWPLALSCHRALAGTQQLTMVCW